MNRSSVDVAVLGAGPAGLAAAEAAAKQGAEVLLIEREERLGGILKQCIHDGFGLQRYGERLTGPEYALRDIERIRHLGVRVVSNTFVHELSAAEDGWRLILVDASEGVRQVQAGALIMATGCRERSDRQVFLQGDRPAGVFTAGQAQRLININGVLPGRKVVILGSGDIGLIMARRFTLEGAQVLGVWEIKPEASGLARNVAQCLEDFDIPLHLRTTVTKVHGTERVEAVTVCPVDEQGRAVEEQAEQVECDTLVLSVGLIPEHDLLRGLALQADPGTRGFFVNQYRQTELPGLFICGNALQVYDLVDYVSQCGAVAGHRAALYALRQEALRQNAQGQDALSRSTRGLGIALETRGEVATLVPQFLLLPESGDAAMDAIDFGSGPGEAPSLFFRSSRVLEGARVKLCAENEVLMSRRLPLVKPQEMECFTLDRNTWRRLAERPPQRLALSVERDEEETNGIA